MLASCCEPRPFLSPSRLQLKVEQELEEGTEGQRSVDLWLEFVGDLWEKHLPHLREELYGVGGIFVYNANTGCYGFQEEEEEEEGGSGDLMAALLREAGLDEEGGVMHSGSFHLQPSSMEEESFAVIPEVAIGHTYDLDQESSEEEKEEEGPSGDTASTLPDECKWTWFRVQVGVVYTCVHLICVVEERLKADPAFKKKMISMAQSIGQGDPSHSSPSPPTFVPLPQPHLCPSLPHRHYT